MRHFNYEVLWFERIVLLQALTITILSSVRLSVTLCSVAMRPTLGEVCDSPVSAVTHESVAC